MTLSQTNLVGPEHYGGRRFAYVANYVATTPPRPRLAPGAVRAGTAGGEPSLQPGLGRERWLFREPAAQPIVTVGYQERIPAIRTPSTGLYLANTTQIYPEDRGTNYSVRLGGEVAAAVLADLR